MEKKIDKNKNENKNKIKSTIFDSDNSVMATTNQNNQ